MTGPDEMRDDHARQQAQVADKPAKVATRPNSQWATGKRRQLDPKPGAKGFFRGARVK